MKNVIIILCLFIILPVKTQTKFGTIEIIIEEIDLKKSGHLWIGLYNNKESFGKLDKAFKMLYIPVTNSKRMIHFKDIRFGTYSVNLFHDENSNKDIDKNFLGIPTEGFGLSNNPKLFGPPGFEKTKFLLSKDTLKMTIRMIY